MELSKSQISELVQNVIDGLQDPLEAYALIKDLSAHLDKAKSEIESAAFEEAAKWTEKTFKHKGFQFTKTEGRATYNFKNVGKWVHYQKALKEIEELSKTAALNSKVGAMMITDDGEVIEPCIVTYSKPSISIKPC